METTLPASRCETSQLYFWKIGDVREMGALPDVLRIRHIDLRDFVLGFALAIAALQMTLG